MQSIDDDVVYQDYILFKKSYNLLFRFSELQQVRVAYQMYETIDTKGMVIDERLLQRTLKVQNTSLMYVANTNYAM